MDALNKALLEATAEPCVLLDRKGNVVLANEAMANRLGIGRSSLTGKDIFSLFPPEMAERRRSYFATVLKTGKALRVEDETSSGTIFIAEVIPVPGTSPEDSPAQVIITIKDISEPKRQEEQRFRLAIALEQAMEGIMILSKEFDIQYINQSFEAMTGYAQKEVAGKNMEILYQGARQQRVLHEVIHSLERMDCWAGRTCNTRKNGSAFECEQTISRIRYKRSKELGYVSVWRDVTEVAALERQLRKAQKMEAIGTLAGGLAHDFNNILGPIILHAELGLQTTAPDTPLHVSLEEILDAANRARGLVNQILSLSRLKEHDQPTAFRLSSIVKECLRLVRPSLPPNIRVDFSNKTQNDMLLADPTQIHQLFMNLCTNAAQAMENNGGELDVQLSNERLEFNSREYQPMEPGEYVRLDVRDTGHGIPSEDMERIFDPFFTTRKEGKGTGLGLAVAQRIVTALGGGISVRSTFGSGALFTVRLPVCPEGYTILDSANRELADPQQPLKVLLVDDDVLLARGGKNALEELGYKVTVSHNAYEALALFRQSPEEYDLVIAEVSLPEFSGMDLTNEIHFSRPELPVALCTSYSAVVIQERAAACGANGVLKKPFTPEELEADLGQLLLRPIQ